METFWDYHSTLLESPDMETANSEITLPYTLSVSAQVYKFIGLKMENYGYCHGC
jgi:hypothetical protein